MTVQSKKRKNCASDLLEEIKIELLMEQRDHAREEHALRTELLQKKIEIASLKKDLLIKQLQ